VRQAPRPPILAPAKGGWNTQPGAQGLPAEPQSLAHGGDAGKPIYPIADCGFRIADWGPAPLELRRTHRQKDRQEMNDRRNAAKNIAGAMFAPTTLERDNPQSAIRNPQ
jgi:hypothetical protein